MHSLLDPTPNPTPTPDPTPIPSCRWISAFMSTTPEALVRPLQSPCEALG